MDGPLWCPTTRDPHGPPTLMFDDFMKNHSVCQMYKSRRVELRSDSEQMYQTDWYWRGDHIRKLSNLWQARFRLRHLWFQLPRYLCNWPIPVSNRVSPSASQIKAHSSLANQSSLMELYFSCKTGFIQNKNEKQSWVKCKCKRDGNCHFRRIENIHCKIDDNLLSRELSTPKILVRWVPSEFWRPSHDLDTDSIWPLFDRKWPILRNWNKAKYEHQWHSLEFESRQANKSGCPNESIDSEFPRWESRLGDGWRRRKYWRKW